MPPCSLRAADWTAGTLYLTENARITGTGTVDLMSTGRFEGRGDLNGNGAVEVTSRSCKLTGTHDFSGNTSCTNAGTRVRGTAAPVGCTPI